MTRLHEITEKSASGFMLFRYLVIVDDIWHWEEWEIIRRALPEGVPRCRILATTRANAIAEKCKFDSGGASIYRYGGINDADAVTLSKTVINKKLPSSRFVLAADTIGDMCRGMPLAVVCLSSAVASLDVAQYFAFGRKLLWHVLVDGLGSISRHPSLKPLAESLRLGYDDLPLHLKTCLLYCSMYPLGYLEIIRHGLVRKWMAEGFFYHQAVAEGCLDELVSRGLLQPEDNPRWWSKSKCYSVHPVMRAFLVCKSKEANFAWYLDEFRYDIGHLDSAGRIRRLSVSLEGFLNDDIIPPVMREGLKRTRSLVGFFYPPDDAAAVRWEQLEYVRVLSIHRRYPVEHIDLPGICSRQLRLRYLGLMGTDIDVLPDQIGKLQRLESLDIRDTDVSQLPKEILELWRLEALYLSNTEVSELPGGIGNLQHLETLDASKTDITELPKEIGKLQHLKTLNVSHTGIMEVPREIGELQRLETLYISYTRVSELPREIGKLRQLKTLNVSLSRVMEVPREIGELQHLETLYISHTRVSELPREIGKLRQLKTLNASHTGVKELPREIGELQHVETLDVSHTSVSELPRETGKMQHLKTLNASHTSVRELPREIGKLWHLTTLNVSHTSVRELPLLLSKSVIVFAGNEHPDEALKLSDDDFAVMQHLEKVVISSSLARPRPGEDLSIMLYDHSYQLLPVSGLKIVGRHMRVPEWVKEHLASASTLDIRLFKLEYDDLSFMHDKMKNLQHLTLKLEVLPRKAIVITGEGFSMLKSFYLDCRLPVVTFQQGAMPKLEHLQFKFYTSRASPSEDPVGICHLLSLKRVVFQSSPRYKSDAPGISAVINKVREEAKEHDNKITISINGKDEEVLQEKKKKKAAWWRRWLQWSKYDPDKAAWWLQWRRWFPIMMPPMMKRGETLFRSRATTHSASVSESVIQRGF